MEEWYEVVEGIDEDDGEDMVEEVGDVMVEVLVDGEMGEDDGFLLIDDVMQDVREKMIGRHG
ncbi:MazG nucleotide pyrophosphohydrolase domain-containing protein, partial [Bacillus pumilus]|uniref:MazG nucleotide pyrophosphohydrolase domain-containing protein n=1 Tax=Bacillus pumilus TaxID=1408 RepID=UPI0034D974F2